MSISQVLGYCFIAFGLGYAGGALQRIIRRSIEVLE